MVFRTEKDLMTYVNKQFIYNIKMQNRTDLELGYQKLTNAHLIKLASNDPNRYDLLHLHCNYIGDEGIKAIINSPFINRAFYLDLYKNEISDEGALAIVESSKTNNIASLNLSRNRISEDGIIALAKCLPGSKIVFLDLRFNPGSNSSKGFDALIESLRHHKILQYLLVEGDGRRILPFLLENRSYVTQTQTQIISVLNTLENKARLHYPEEVLNLDILEKFEVIYYNVMLNRDILNENFFTCKRIRNYINDHYFKITKVVRDRLQPADLGVVSLSTLPADVLGYITMFCTITDVKS